MNKLTIRGVDLDEDNHFDTLLIGYADDVNGFKNSVQFECQSGHIHPPTPLGTTLRMTHGMYIGFTPEMEPRLMNQLSPAVKLKLMELLQKQSL